MKLMALMTLYQPQPCIANEQGAFVTIRYVDCNKKSRLCRTEGNVNFTDYWLSMFGVTESLNGIYSYQNFNLLSSNTEDNKNLLRNCENKFVLICLLKICSDVQGINITKVKQKIEEITNKVNAICFRTMDNADLILVLADNSEESVKDILKEVKKIKIEDQSPYYSVYWVCGGKAHMDNEILKVPKCKIADKDEIYLYKNNIDGKWCRKEFNSLKANMKQFIQEKNQKKASYYQALIQIINVLTQYEQEDKLKDFFYIFYPPIKLFLEQLEEGETAAGKMGVADTSLKYKALKDIDTSVSTFIDTLELLIYHMGHSCPNILNANGRNGLAYDIPIRLCLLYVAYLDTVSEILNDTSYNYEYCLMPVTYSRPKTTYFEFGLPATNRLIQVQISRHTMYMPRALFTILAHEVCHYVGRESRSRKMRAEKFLTIVAVLLCETIMDNNTFSYICKKLNQSFDNDEKEIRNAFEKDWDFQKKKMLIFIQQEILKKYNERKRKQEEEQQVNGNEYHFLHMFKNTESICKEIAIDAEHLLEDIISRHSHQFVATLKYHSKPDKIMALIMHEEASIANNRLYVLSNKEFYQQLVFIMDVMKEIYADVGAILLLELSFEDYLEAYIISESYNLESDIISGDLINRVAIVWMVMFENKLWPELSKDKYNDFSNDLVSRVEEYIKDYQHAKKCRSASETLYNIESAKGVNAFDIVQVIDCEKEYLLSCYQKLEEQIISNKNSGENVACLRDMYKNFKVFDLGKDTSFEDFFDSYEKLVNTYKSRVNRKWEEEVN